MINIAVLGYGTIGSGVVEVLKTNGESIRKRAGDKINIKICFGYKRISAIRLWKFLFMM